MWTINEGTAEDAKEQEDMGLMSKLKVWWLRMSIADMELEIDELHAHIGQFLEMVEHKQALLKEKRQELQSIEKGRP